MGGSIDWLLSLTGQIEDWIMGVADAWWVYLVVYGFAAFDGFFPTVPSESTIVTLSSLWSSSGRPLILLIGFAAWMGAWTGDNLGYWLGSKIGWERFKFLREGKGRRAVEAADRGLQRRALLFLMTARYIPFGRTAVNLVAGAVHYPHKEFWPRSLLSTFVWAAYSCAIGAIAGAWFGEHHLLAITAALIAAVVLALIVERLIAAMHRILDRRAERRGEVLEDRLGMEGSSEAVADDHEDTTRDDPEHLAHERSHRDQAPGDRGPETPGPADRGHHDRGAEGRGDQDSELEDGHNCADEVDATPLSSQGQDSPA
ncbi:DedA family protein [Brachybacterium fresconis]|uniref:Membrane protein DedA with SNARE-associated domain n=1 Tax=Brachybacterium fresconis TaxID=173363 RepID=A0ABS4YSY9_9MICO|nr:DedA family protein [Brachybacterium fresconis]MBP2411088.1 membrane protein DedA with SNARE-associated domain [Brachybacterium fresconis]